MQSDTNYLFKVLLIGDSNVGKSSLLVRYADNHYYTEYISTIGIDYRIKSMELDNGGQTVQVKLQLWDTAGQEKFDNIVQSYYRGAHGIMVVFDVTDRNSFDNVKKWLDKATQNAGADVVKLLVGTKIDLDKRLVSQEEAQTYASEQKLEYIETSAKESTNVPEAFQLLASLMLKKAGPGQQTSIHSLPAPEPKPVKAGCC